MKHLAVKLAIAVWLISGIVHSACAQALLNTQLKDAPKHDFICYFDFKPTNKIVPAEGGLRDYVFMSDTVGSVLELGADKNGVIQRIRLSMPRELIDKPKNVILGRDIGKSFLRAAALGLQDSQALESLMNEIWIRDLDLHPASVKASTFEDTGKPVPPNAYKVGSGPVEKGDRLIFIPKMPVLAPKASQLYGAFVGKRKAAATILFDTRLSFQNSQEHPILICEAWDDGFWRSKIGPKPQIPPRTTEMMSALAKCSDYNKQRQFSKVISILEPLSKKYPSDLDCVIALGSALEDSGDHKGAIEVFRKAALLEKEQGKPSALFHLKLAKTLLALGMPAYAFEEGGKAQAISPNDASIMFEYGLVMVESKNPLYIGTARSAFEKSEKMGHKDQRLPALTALAEIRMGRQAKGLAALRNAISVFPTTEENAKFVQELKTIADELDKKLKEQPPAPVPPKERKYDMSQDTMGVVADRDEDSGLITMCLAGGHDPDGGEQDGTDDGIIQFLWDNASKPSSVYRQK